MFTQDDKQMEKCLKYLAKIYVWIWVKYCTIKAKANSNGAFARAFLLKDVSRSYPTEVVLVPLNMKDQQAYYHFFFQMIEDLA